MKKLLFGVLGVCLFWTASAQSQNWEQYIFHVNDDLWFHLAKPVDPQVDDIYHIGDGCSDGNSSDFDLNEHLNSGVETGQDVYIFNPETTQICSSVETSHSVSTGTYESNLKVSGLSASTDEYTSKIEVSWDLFVHSGNQKAADGYMLFVSEGDSVWTNEELVTPLAVTYGDVTLFEHTNLVFNKSYYYKVVAYYLDYDHSLGSKWITNHTESVSGSTSAVDYTVTALNEYEMKHEFTMTYDVYSGFEKQSLHYTIVDNTLGDELTNSSHTSNLQDHLESENPIFSLGELSLEATGDDSEGVYGTLPSSFTGLSYGWTLEMIAKIDSLDTGYNATLLSNDDDNLLGIRSSGNWDLLGDSLDLVKTDEWHNLSLTYDGQVLRFYIDGISIGQKEHIGLGAPKYINGDKDQDNFITDLDLGLVRAWAVARSKDQLYHDKFDKYESGNMPASLVDEWILSDPTQADAFGVKNERLAFVSSGTPHSVRWQESFVLGSTNVTISFTQYVKPASTHSYTLKVSEEGSGKIHSTVNATATSQGSPGGNLTASFDGGDMSLRLVTSAVAEKYQIWRSDNVNDELIQVALLEIPENEWGNSVDTTWADAYELLADNPESRIQGGRTYTYSAVPVYTKISAGEFTNDGGKIVASNKSTPDLGLNVVSSTDDNTLGWTAPSGLTAYTSDSVMITRDGEIIARLVDQSTYADDQMVYGKTHTYGVHPIKNGEIIFGQYETATIAANGIVRGWFLDAKNDLVLPTFETTASAQIEGDPNSISIATDAARNGGFESTEIYYGEKATYTFDRSSDQFTLSKADHNKQLLVSTDSIAPVREAGRGEFRYGMGQTNTQLEVHEVANVNTFDVRIWGLGQELATGAQFYTNMYRNDKLIGVCSEYNSEFPNSNQGLNGIFTDSTGIAGESYSYRFRTYYYNLDEELFVYKDTVMIAEYNTVSGASNLTASEFQLGNISNDAIKLTFSYDTANVKVDRFEVYRRRTEVADAEEILIGELNFEDDGAYSFVDITGIPNTNYEYSVVAVMGNNQSDPVSQEIVYPLIVDGTLAQVQNGSNDSKSAGVFVRLQPQFDVSGNTNFDGYIVWADDKIVATLSTAQAGETSPLYRFRFKNYSGSFDESTTYKWARYKYNQEGLYLFDEHVITDDHSEGFGPAYSNDYPNMTINVTSRPGYHKVTWVDKANATVWDQGIRADRYMISTSASSLSGAVEVDQTVGSWSGSNFEGSNPSKLYLLAVDSDDNILASLASANVANPSNNGILGIWPIENFQASDDVREGVFLTWEYKSFSDAQFEIYRDGTLVHTTQAGARWYYDQEISVIEANTSYAYQVRAVYDQDGDGSFEDYSTRATDAGMRRVPYAIEGHVYDDQRLGVPHLAVNVGRAWAMTDGTGYYRLEGLFKTGAVTLYMNAYDNVNTQDHAVSKTITLTEDQMVYTEDFTITSYDYDGMPESNGPADAFAIAGYPDADALGVHLKIQLTPGYYDGVEVLRMGMLVADLKVGENLEVTDIGGSSGQSYTYVAQPYVIDAEGVRLYGRATSTVVSYPALDSPGYFEAVAANGHIQLTWADAAADRSYVLTRNEEVLAEVAAQTFTYTDATGEPNSTYRYKIYAVKNGAVSENPAILDGITYPYPEQVDSLSQSIDINRNAITISWTYPQDAGINRVEVLRNSISLFITDELDTSYTDSTGIPATETTYGVVTYKAGDENGSAANILEVIYPELPAISSVSEIPDQRNMVDTIKWTYQVKSFDGFEVVLTDNNGVERPTFIASILGQTSYQFVVEGILSGQDYTVDIVPRATRKGTEYYGPVHQESSSMSDLPAPVLTITPESESESLHNYALLEWEYSDLPIHGWELNIDDSTYILGAGERSYLISRTVPNHTYNIKLKALVTGGSAGVEVSRSWTSGDFNDDYGQFATITATSIRGGDALVNGIRVEISNPRNNMRLYRDGKLIKDFFDRSYSFVDYDVNPGERYLYELQARTAVNTSVAEGSALGMDGQLSGSIKYRNGQSVGSGVPVRISGSFDGRYVIDTVYTVSNGQYAIKDLPYSDQSDSATTYRATPLQGKTDSDDNWKAHSVPVVYSPGQAERELVSGLNISGFDLLFDESSVTFTGQVRHALSDIGSLDGTIALYKDPSGANELMAVQNTSDTRYTMSVPYGLNWQELALKYTPNGQEFDEEVYQYIDSVLTFNAADVLPGQTMVNHFIDTLLVPVNIKVMEGECTAIEDYTWKMFLTEVGGTYDTLIEMKGNVSLQLPAKNFEARMLDVTPLTSYSKSVLEQLLTEKVSISLGDSLKAYTDSYDESQGNTDTHKEAIPIQNGSFFVNAYAFTYVPGLVMSADWDGDTTPMSCSGGVTNENVEAVITEAIDVIELYNADDDNIYALSLTIAAGDDCEVTEGYVVVKNGAGTSAPNQSDTLEYQDQEWDTYSFQAGNVNTSAPYTRGIEFSYYNANDKYITTYVKTVIVEGAKTLEGSGFILDTQENLYPLYVLHDPPGDGSSAWIEKGSSLSYKIDHGFEVKGGLEVGSGTSFNFGGLKVDVDYSAEASTSYSDSRSTEFSLNFNERLATSGDAAYHFESEKYQLGKPSDIIVGLGVINKYGVAREIAVDGDCKLNSGLTITVQPNEISTKWIMTRNTLEEDMEYYKRLEDEAAIEGGGKDDEDFDLDTRIENIRRILAWYDFKYRVPVKVCELVEHIKNRTTKSKREEWNIQEDFDKIRDFCKDTELVSKPYSNTSDKWSSAGVRIDGDDDSYYMDGMYDEDRNFVPSWDDKDIVEFDEVMGRFQDLWTTWELIQANRDEEIPTTLGFTSISAQNDNLSDAEFDYVENLSFSAGLNYSKSFSYSESGSKTIGAGTALNFSGAFFTKQTVQFDVSQWAGIGVGTLLTSSSGKFETRTGTYLKLTGGASYNISQVESKSKSFSLGYTLSDDDPGDEFNVWVMIDPTGHNYYSSPEFYLTSGQSSCPWEKGTIKRDDFKISMTDDDGNPVPTTVTVEGDELLVFKMKLENLSPIGELRKGATTGGPNTGKDGETVMANGNFPVHPIFPSSVFTEGSEPLYFTATLSKMFAPAVKGTVVFRPYIGGACNVTDLAPDHTSFFELRMIFISPTSPISLPTSRGDWLISRKLNSFGEEADRTLGIELNDLKVGNDLYQLDQVMVMARNTSDAQNDWTIIKDQNQLSTIPVDSLENGYSVFSWTPDPQDFPDGEYDLKGIVIGEDGGREESDPWRGRIDLTKPFLAQAPQPADGLLSKGDIIGLTMNEDINAGKFMVRAGEIVTMEVYDMDNENVEHTVHYDSDYNFSELVASVNGAGLNLWLDEDVLTEYDGQPVKVTVSGLQDLAGNAADDITWWFKLDAFNWPVSEISMFVQNSVDDGGRFWLNAMDDRTNQAFYASDYDVYNKISMLDRIQLQFRTADGNPGSWLTLDQRTIAELRDGSNGFTTDLSGNAEGTYDFRLVAWAGASSRASNIIRATIDVTAPEVVSTPDILDGVSEFDVTFSEAIRSQGALTASINGQSFGALRALTNGETVSFVIDTTHADYALLGNRYGYDLEITLDNASDLAGNPWTESLDLPIGNYTTTLSPIELSSMDWLMNLDNESTTFTITDYDLSGTEGALDSVVLVYRKANTMDYVTIADWDRAALLTEGADFGYTWDISGTALADGDYKVHAVVYGDGGNAFYSDPAEGVIDRTAPVYVNVFEPADEVYNDTDKYFSFEFSEPIGAADDVIIRQKVTSHEYVLIDPSMYHKVIEGNQVRIIPASETFLALYSNEKLRVDLVDVEDEYGNVMADNHHQIFTMQDFGYLNTGSRQVTDLKGAPVETGEIEVSWTSYQAYDKTILERSRDGQTYVEVASYLGDISQHLDEVNFNTVIFYRLKQTQDTTSHYSKVIGVENDNRIPVLVSHLYPNPSNGSEFELSVLTNNLDDEMMVNIIDINGKVVHEESLSAQSVLHSNVKFTLEEPLKTGIYQLVLTQGDKKQQQKLVVFSDGRP